MTDKPMTPREDVEALLDRLESAVYTAPEAAAASMLRALLAERDAQKGFRDECERQLQKSFDDLAAMISERNEAYRRGQEDMRSRVMNACDVLGATHEVKMRDIPSGGYVATYENTAAAIASLPIKETPNA